MRFVMFAMLLCLAGCVQIDNGQTPPVPKPNEPDVVPVPDSKIVDQALLAEIMAAPELSNATVCRKYAALYRSFAEGFRERTDIPAMQILSACFKTAQQFIDTESPLVSRELQKLNDTDKSRESLAAAFDRLSATFLAAADRKK